MITTPGRAYEQRGTVYIKTTRPAVDNLAGDVTVVWRDARQISDEQRRKAYALLGEITAWAGYMPRETKSVNEHLKQRFLMQQVEEYQRVSFSLSDCSVTRAREYISYLIDFCLLNDVPTRGPLMELADDLAQLTYSCLIHRHCAACGKRADLHHVDQVGMGYSRKEKPQLGALAMPLCREHHGEYHVIGRKQFELKYHVVPVRIDERIAKVYGMTKDAQREGEYGQAV